MCGALELYLQAQIRFSLKPIENSTDSNHAVYSHDIIEQLMELSDYMNTRKIRFDSKFKIKTSFYSSTIEDEILQGIGNEPGFDLEKQADAPKIIDSPVNSRGDPDKHVTSPELEQMRWNEIVTTFFELNNIQRPRYCIPSMQCSCEHV